MSENYWHLKQYSSIFIDVTSFQMFDSKAFVGQMSGGGYKYATGNEFDRFYVKISEQKIATINLRK